MYRGCITDDDNLVATYSNNTLKVVLFSVSTTMLFHLHLFNNIRIQTKGCDTHFIINHTRLVAAHRCLSRNHHRFAHHVPWWCCPFSHHHRMIGVDIVRGNNLLLAILSLSLSSHTSLLGLTSVSRAWRQQAVTQRKMRHSHVTLMYSIVVVVICCVDRPEAFHYEQ